MEGFIQTKDLLMGKVGQDNINNMGQNNMGQDNMGQDNMGQDNMGQDNMGQHNIHNMGHMAPHVPAGLHRWHLWSTLILTKTKTLKVKPLRRSKILYTTTLVR